jgi:hypothetical protein
METKALLDLSVFVTNLDNSFVVLKSVAERDEINLVVSIFKTFLK